MSHIRSLTIRAFRLRGCLSSLSATSRVLTFTGQVKFDENSAFKDYMVEFRGVQSPFRLNEFLDSYRYVIKETDHAELQYTSIIADVLDATSPICAYVRLPNDTVATTLTKRCSLVRSISQVWGDAESIDDVRAATEANYDSLIAPHFNENPSENTWRVDFRRYGRSGRSGLDPEGKRNVLRTFNDVMMKMNGTVSLMNNRHTLLYLEDWSTYRSWVDGVTDTMRKKQAATIAVSAVAITADASQTSTQIGVEDTAIETGRHTDGVCSSSSIDDADSYISESVYVNEKVSVEDTNRRTDNDTLSNKTPCYPKRDYTADDERISKLPAGERHAQLSLRSVNGTNSDRRGRKDFVPSLAEVNQDDGSYRPIRCVTYVFVE